ncbi:MAG: hypothetical protein JXQ76_08385, partial [Campylobacterales bacterium]|nr:hypothetical protein [Campylobacterales bacterium]
LKDFILWCELNYEDKKIIIDIKTDIEDNWEIFAYHHHKASGSGSRILTSDLEELLNKRAIMFEKIHYDNEPRAKLTDETTELHGKENVVSFVIEVARKIKNSSENLHI